MSSLLAIIFGIAFGFILQRAGALDYKNILNTLRLKDLTIAKFMFFSVGLSAIGIFSLRSLGLITLNIINFNVVGTLLGGLIFGIGFAVSGYCPGTSVGAFGEGKKDAGYVILGGMFGALFYTMFQGEISALIFQYDKGSMMLGDLFSINTLMLAGIYSAVIGLVIYFVDRLENKSPISSTDNSVSNSVAGK